MRDIFKNMTYYFENADPILNIPQPYSEKIKFIGGIGVKQVQPLTEVSFSIEFLNKKYFAIGNL